MAKHDPYNNKKMYLAWKERVKNGIDGISESNSDIIKSYMSDMELGLNVVIRSKKGARSYIRLNTLRNKLCFFARQFEKQFNHYIITDITEEQLHKFFNDMKTGALKKKDGREYSSTSYYVSVFKSFWHWDMQIQKKHNKKEISDITIGT